MTCSRLSVVVTCFRTVTVRVAFAGLIVRITVSVFVTRTVDVTRGSVVVLVGVRVHDVVVRVAVEVIHLVHITR